jgi:hypothetical protein
MEEDRVSAGAALGGCARRKSHGSLKLGRRDDFWRRGDGEERGVCCCGVRLRRCVEGGDGRRKRSGFGF